MKPGPSSTLLRQRDIIARRLAAAAVLITVATATVAAETPLLLRARSFLVPPSTGPVTHVVVRNQSSAPYSGTLRVRWPEGWRVTPDHHTVVLEPGEVKECAFALERATNSVGNAYPLRLQVAGPAAEVTVDQTVFCASAPYGKPTIDGELGDWEDAIPLTFATGGRRATLRTLWNRRQFCLAVEVEETRLTGLGALPGESAIDALQFALAKPPKELDEPNVDRYEFVVAAVGPAGDDAKCFLLCTPGQAPAVAAERRRLSGLEVAAAAAVVKRSAGVTRYEVSVPFKLMGALRPAPGRELRFSLLVHDPEGTGIRDLGEVMNLWKEQRQPGAWCSWQGVKWGEDLPFWSNVEFGLCSSIH